MTRLKYAALACLAAALPAAGQTGPDSAGVGDPVAGGPLRAWVPLSSVTEDRLRVQQLRGGDERGGYLVRSTSSLLPRRPGSYLVVLAPRADLTWNSRIPYSINDGAAWAGRGLTSRSVVGIEAVAGPVRLIAAPELVSEQNAEFDDLLPGAWDAAQRERFTTPWSVGQNAIDLPYRFGDQSVTRLLAGESSLLLRAGPIEGGVATESQWWGPGIRNAILITDNAGGIPHALLRTAHPLGTPVGAISVTWMAGRLWSTRFDTASGGSRTVSGAAVVLNPFRGLDLGMGRVVYATADDPTAGDAAAVFTRWRGAGDTTAAHPYEQMFSLFGRWRLIPDGAEVYFEWARRRLPTPRQLLEQPEDGQGYVLGGQWTRPAGSGSVRLQGEFTYLEESSTYRAHPVGTWYAGRAVPQGYTHRGQVLGAAIGPGASSQWFATDYLAPRWQLGASVNRIRWANDAYYQQGPNKYLAHDVSVLAGLRASVCVAGAWVTAQWTGGPRYNFMFQDSARDFTERSARSVSPVNHTLQLSISPRLP
jgi:hypothetical protein